jgi:hypothetical protein
MSRTPRTENPAADARRRSAAAARQLRALQRSVQAGTVPSSANRSFCVSIAPRGTGALRSQQIVKGGL